MLCAWVTLVLGVALEERLMQTPIEQTVTDFEVAEEGLSVVLTNAIEDAREVVDYLTKQHDIRQRRWVEVKNEAAAPNIEAFLEKGVRDSAEMQFRAMRVLVLLEATREREAGQVT